ncbi:MULTISPECIES: hypothetical protein [unclassified Pseudomonas]|uniref:hypothetical protein n=1 Tax=unclassified Pseudomonas TaxID=196821 RepID=UPI000D6EC980|nr:MULTISPECIES: hypothetical protein [unclassified Pseudomonas]PWU25720.1 hypothetical protein DK254_24030 [Pseudomonas sp. RW407]
MPEKSIPPPASATPGKLRYFAALDDWQAMLSTFSSTRSLLAEARTWLGDGINAGRLARDVWPAGLAGLLERIDTDTVPKRRQPGITRAEENNVSTEVASMSSAKTGAIASAHTQRCASMACRGTRCN